VRAEDWKPSPQPVTTGTISAIAASLMAQGVDWNCNSTIWDKNSGRGGMIRDFVLIAREIVAETIRQEMAP